MPGAQIAIDQDRPGPTVSVGTDGYARNDLWLGRVVHPRSVNTGTSYAWTLLDKPPGSTAVITSATSQTCAFTPDLAGSYRLELVLNGGGLGNLARTIAACTFDNLGVEVNNGWRVPALGETSTENNFGGQTRSWDEALRNIFNDLLTAGGSLAVYDEAVLAGTRAKLNFIGAGVVAVDNPGQLRVDVTIPGFTGVQVKEEGSSLGTTFTAFNFIGGIVTATDAGGGVANISVLGTNGMVVKDEGSTVTGGPHTAMNFAGAGVTASDAGGGVALITIPQGAPTIQEEGSPLAGGPHSTLNFIGSGITAADAGGGVASITVTGKLVIQDESVTVAGGPHTTLNFLGATVAVTDGGGGVANVTVSGVTALPEVEASLVAGVFSTINSSFTRAGSRTLDPLYWPATIGALTRSIYFKADVECSTPGTTANVRLRNITDNETVTSTDLNTGLQANTEVTSAALTVGVAAGNLKSGTPKQYEVQVSLTGGGAGDTVTITNARLCVRYT